ncbi:MAG: hypothetical protein PV347_06965 [Rickettsiaceae bacterium]|nr:hypothetical protein [Rickettsiaceae bacterium]MDD9337847.1 hypothetical protein [Rickettsiaceae bacterium]
MSQNDINDLGADILAKFLANNRTLKRIHLDNNHIGPNGSFKLCKALELNSTLTEITLNGTLLYHNEAEELVKSLKNKKIVSKIMLSFYDHEKYDMNSNYHKLLELLTETYNNYIE